MAKPITWTNAKRKLSELIPWERNPRFIRPEERERLQQSFTEFGQPETIAIGPANELYNGHQRLKTWAAEFGDIEIDCRVSSRPLTEKEREKLVVFLHRGATGEWDFDMLHDNFNFDELVAWGFDPEELGVIPAPPSIDGLGDEYGEAQEDDLWPVVRVRVDPGTFRHYKEIMESLPGSDDTQKFSAMLDRVVMDELVDA